MQYLHCKDRYYTNDLPGERRERMGSNLLFYFWSVHYALYSAHSMYIKGNEWILDSFSLLSQIQYTVCVQTFYILFRLISLLHCFVSHFRYCLHSLSIKYSTRKRCVYHFCIWIDGIFKASIWFFVQVWEEQQKKTIIWICVCVFFSVYVYSLRIFDTLIAHKI